MSNTLTHTNAAGDSETATFAEQPVVSESLSQTVNGLNAAQDEKTPVDTVESRDLFVFIYQAGPAWRPGLPVEKQDLREHAQYMKRLLETNKLFAAGPLAAVPGGIVLMYAMNQHDANTLARQDPAVVNEVFTVNVFQWTPRFASELSLDGFFSQQTK